MSETGIVISTSRKPSQRTRSFCKELQVFLPNAHYVQRGKSNFEELLRNSEQLEATLLVLIGERDGNPGSLELYSVEKPEESAFLFEIRGVRLAREFGTHVRSRSKRLAFSSDSNEDSVDLQNLLERLFLDEPGFRSNSLRTGTRILSISHLKDGGFRLTFRDPESGRELGPSITGRLTK